MTDKQDDKPQHRMSKEEYLKQLEDMGMDEPTRKSYMKRMETYTPNDYDKAAEEFLDMMGEPTEEQLKKPKKK